MSVTEIRKEPLSVVEKLIDLLRRVPQADRARFALTQLQPHHPRLIHDFLTITGARRERAVLFFSPQPHSRELRLAACAQRAGYEVHVITGVRNHFGASVSSNHVVADPVHQILATWLFPGALVQGFTLRGDLLFLHTHLKPRRWIVDIYDTTAGTFARESPEAAAERYVIEHADGLIHRDLRLHRLARAEKLKLPKSQLFLHDPIEARESAVSTRAPGTPLHVVSTGWIGKGPNAILRTVESLCKGGVHVHLCFSPMQGPQHPDVQPYVELAQKTSLLHLHGTLSGDAYWDLLRQCQFGLSIFEPDIFGESLTGYTRDSLEACGSSRLSDYVACGLGVIGSRTLRFQALLARHLAPVYVEANAELLTNPEKVLAEAFDTRRNRDLRSFSETCARSLGNFYKGEKKPRNQTTK